jgi:secreted trypsin-like serine protease
MPNTDSMLHPKNIHGEIVGGTVAVPYSWPWQVVWCTGGGFDARCQLECGGTVIDNNWVMTAGHCVYGQTTRPQNFRIKAGVFDERSVYVFSYSFSVFVEERDGRAVRWREGDSSSS